MPEKIAAIVLAAGAGKRMRSKLPKVCHLLAEQPMLSFPVAAGIELSAAPLIVVVNGDPGAAGQIKAALKPFVARPKISYAVQKKPLGTADAVASAMPLLRRFSGTVLILNGDAPLLQSRTLSDFLRAHRARRSILSLVSMHLDNPTGYGRILRAPQGRFGCGGVENLLGIIEEKDASPEQRCIREVNAGVYAVEAAYLREAIGDIHRDNQQNEYYLTDLLGIALQRGHEVQAYLAGDAREFLGVNSLGDLLAAERVLNQLSLENMVRLGVRVLDPTSTVVGPKVEVAPQVTLHPGCILRGDTKIAAHAELGPFVCLQDTQVGKAARIKAFSVLEGAVIGPQASVGPFAHLRPGTKLAAKARVGNFVELKKTLMGVGAKANHLAYLGDAWIGARANIGAGTITCNYDGYQKYQTHIDSDAFIGSDTQLVAPVRVGKGAVVGAGTTVTANVPAGALALSRVRQSHIPGYTRRKKRLSKKPLRPSKGSKRSAR